MSRPDSNRKSSPDFSFEQLLADEGYSHIAGVDEAGRGPWAGAVVAACVVLDADNIPSGLDDSKKLNASRRDQLFDEIMQSCDCGVAIIDEKTIDEINILQATMLAMRKAVEGLSRGADYVLVDGNRVPPLNVDAEALVRGDGRSLSIAAASIVAKVTRDRLMIAADEEYPGYGFARHKGYGTRAHSDALIKLGPCPLHRRSFKPVRALLERQ